MPKRTAFFEKSGTGTRHISVILIGILAACACLAVLALTISGFWEKSARTDSDITELPAGAYVPAQPELVLDSTVETDRTNDEIVDWINNFDAEAIDEAFVYFNSSTRAGKALTFSADHDPEQLKAAVSLVFNDKITYDALEGSETHPDDYSKNYDFYITYRDTETAESTTIFVFHAGTEIRADGLYLKASPPLDLTAFENAVHHLILDEQH